MPATRSINALANGLRNPALRRIEQAVPLMPSAPGDPLLMPGQSVASGHAVLSAPLAQSLALGPGDQAEILIGRELDGRRETARALLTVSAVLPAERYGRSLLLLSLDDLTAIERFRDDPAITTRNWRGNHAAPTTYASFRLYAPGLRIFPACSRR